jgi:hypothetical protein
VIAKLETREPIDLWVLPLEAPATGRPKAHAQA